MINKDQEDDFFFFHNHWLQHHSKEQVIGILHSWHYRIVSGKVCTLENISDDENDFVNNTWCVQVIAFTKKVLVI
jgi:hypothetical protein